METPNSFTFITYKINKATRKLLNLKENQGFLKTSTEGTINFELKFSEKQTFRETVLSHEKLTIVFSDNQSATLYRTVTVQGFPLYCNCNCKSKFLRTDNKYCDSTVTVNKNPCVCSCIFGLKIVFFEFHSSLQWLF